MLHETTLIVPGTIQNFCSVENQEGWVEWSCYDVVGKRYETKNVNESQFLRCA